jgi:hypothetical protein
MNDNTIREYLDYIYTDLYSKIEGVNIKNNLLEK